MMRLFFSKSVKIAFAIALTFFMVTGCPTTNHEGFSIYLTKYDIPPLQMEALSYVDIADQPIISMADIITYNAQTHEITITANAFERIYQLDVPISGKSFMVCINKSPIYWGAFWTPISSMLFDGVTIWQPLGSQETKIVKLDLGYPSTSFYSGKDPRNDAKIMKSFEQVGKLIKKLSITDVYRLPSAMKGYELYSWEENGEWNFTLITGTNRTKTMEEITSKDDFISETTWVNIHVIGVTEIKEVLNKLPKGESVLWCEELHIAQISETNLKLPPKQITDTIKECAQQCGLNLTITIFQ